jgi:glucose-6-phosphate dehydrogenase assembly protein OpcA
VESHLSAASTPSAADGTLGDALWSAQGTTPDAVEAALRELECQRTREDSSFVPARVLNMIVFADRAWSGEVANRLSGVGRYHASRLLVFEYEPRRDRLDARVAIESERRAPGEMGLLRETVTVRIGDRHLDDLVTIADPLVISDLPTLLWSPHGHADAVDALLPLAQEVLLDSVDEPVWREAIERAAQLSAQTYVVDLAWLRSTPWRERIAALFDPPTPRTELQRITKVAVRHHPASTVAALFLIGWLASRLGWSVEALLAHGDALIGKAHARRSDVALRLQAAPEQQVRGLAGLTIETSSGRRLSLDRGPGGLHAHLTQRAGSERSWTLLGASRGEGGILGEGIRQALLRDPTYLPALRAARAMLP